MDEIGEYLNRIGQHPLLTADDERRLSAVIAQGRAVETAKPEPAQRTVSEKRKVRLADQAAERFWLSNLRLAFNIAKRYPLPHGVDLMDLVQEANIGLRTATRKFDGRKGFKFSTYATFWVRQSIGRAIDNYGSTIRLPGDKAAALRTALRAVDYDDELLDPEMRALWELTTSRSLNAPMHPDSTGHTELHDMISCPGSDVGRQILDMRLGDAVLAEVDKMPEAQAYIVKRRFGLLGEPASLRVIGEELATYLDAPITSEGVRRRLHWALAELAPSLESWVDTPGEMPRAVTKEIARQQERALSNQLSLPIG